MVATQKIELHSKLQNRQCITNAVLFDDDNPNQLKEYKASDIVQLKDNGLVKALQRTTTKHTASSNETAGINELSNILLEEPAPDAIGRMLVHVIETMKQSLKIRISKQGKAVKTSRAKRSVSFGDKPEYLTFIPDKEFEVNDEWDQNYLEDADHDVAASQARMLSTAMQTLETEVILDELNAVPNADLAGGAEVNQAEAGSLKFIDLVNLWERVKTENHSPNSLAMSPKSYASLLKDTVFIDTTLYGEFIDRDTGMFGMMLFGLQIYVSSLVGTKVYCLDSMQVIMYVLRRDAMMRNWTEGRANKDGIQISTRYDIGVGLPEAMSRMTATIT